MLSNIRLNRLRYIAYSGFLFICLMCVGTASENKYGVTPPLNNYFTISLCVLCMVMLIAMNAVVFIQTQKD
jgi:hypothetical protein